MFVQRIEFIPAAGPAAHRTIVNAHFGPLPIHNFESLIASPPSQQFARIQSGNELVRVVESGWVDNNNTIINISR